MEKNSPSSQLGQRMGINRERVRQIEKQALNLLRRYGDNVHCYR